MGKIGKGQTCSISGCGKQAERSLPLEEAGHVFKSSELQTNPGSRRVYLCDAHYKVYKKGTKKEKTFEKWRRWGYAAPQRGREGPKAFYLGISI